MDFSIPNEVIILLSSSAAGAIISVIYDLFKFIRKKVRTGLVLSNIHDILFWCIAIFIMFFTIFYISNGRLRWYQFLGAFCGSIIYFSLLSQPFLFLFERFFDIFFKIFIFFLKILLTPLKITYKILSVSLSFLIMPIVHLLKKLIRKLYSFAKKNIQTIRFIIRKK